MKKTLTNHSLLLLNALVFAGLLAMTMTGRATIVGPYTADANTLHLWHLDESAVPCVDSVPSGGINLLDLATGATLGNAGFAGPFTTALNTAPGGAAKGDLLAASATAGNVTITLADTTSGAFTFEAVVLVSFDPTVSSTSALEILSGESGTTANRIFQWRLAPIGFTLIAGNVATTPYITFENIRGGSGGQGTIFAPLPTTGPDAIVSNKWYHVAVSYNGVPNTANNIKFYWTLMDTNRTSANQLTISSAVTTLSGLNPLATVTTPFMVGNQARSKNGNFVGMIDEIRISKVERNAAQMMFAPASATIVTQPPPHLLVAAGDTVNIAAVGGGGGTLGFQWLFNGTNLPATQNPTATNLTFVVTNINTNQAGAYQLVVTNATSQATSMVASVQVGGVATTLFNTGVDDNGKLLPGGAQDLHWQLVQSADPSFPGPNTYAVSSPVAAWLPNGPNSKWLAPADGPNIAAGLFTYQTTFLLDSEDPTNTQITGNWVSDNQGQNIILNGVSLGITNTTSIGSFTSFTITNGFVPGFNTLQCVVSNNPGGGNNPSGVRVELRAVGLPLPPAAPQLVSSPTNISTQTRQSATFSVAAIGSAPLTYQWYFGATPLTTQTNRTLALQNLTPAQSGSYSVIVSNNLGTTNASASLTVVTPPAVAWLGLNSGDWDTNTVNWLDTNTLADVTYAMLDDVIFDDRGSSAQPIVNLTQALTPNSILVNSSNNYTFTSFSGGFLTGSFDLTKDGPSTLILDTPNTYNGNTIILNGTLQIGNADFSGSLGSGVVSNNATLVLDRADTFFVPPAITGTGSVAMIGPGSAILTGNNSYTGPTTVASGQINARSSTALGTADAGTTVMDGAQLYIDFGINFTNEPLVLGGTGIVSDGALRKGGATTSVWGGPITLSDYAGIQVDSGSSLTLTNPAAITSADINLAMQCLGTGVLTINGAVNLGAGNVTEFGTGTIVLSATNNNWTGGTTISGGTLQIGDGGNDGSIGNGPIEDDTTLTFLSSGNLVITNAITGSGVLNQSGSGTLTLNGTNAYSSTRINGNGVLVPGNSQALGAGTVTIGAGQTDTGYLLLNGGLFLANQFAIFPRAFGVQNNPPNFVNAAGTNIINSPSSIVIPGGGNLLTFESDSGFLSISNGVTAGGAGRDLVMKGAGNGEIVGNIDHSANNSVLVWKLDPGTWTLWGNNTPGAATTISNGTLIINGSMDASPVVCAGGTLAGTGIFAGPVAISAGAKLAPTSGIGPIGTMTISNTLSLAAGSSTVLQLNRSAGTNDQIVGLTNVTYGGTLNVSNIAGNFAQGDIFPLFSSAAYGGGFSGIVPASPGAGLKWNLNSLVVDGTLRVTTTNQSHGRKITSTTVAGTSLVFSGTGGSIGGSYVLLSSTNVVAPLSTWTRVRTNIYDGSGGFTVTNAIGASGNLFYALQAQ